MSKKSETTAVEVPKSTLPVTSSIDFGADAGAGLEGADSASFAIPFLVVVQKMSPICDEASGSYNPDAKPGMLMNTVTGELLDGKEGVEILQAYYQRRFLRWGSRDDKGGFKGEVMPEVAAQWEHEGLVRNVDGRLYFPLEDGTINEKKCDRLADVRNHFCVLCGTGQKVLLTLGSTQIKKSKALISMLSGVRVGGVDGKPVTAPTWATKVLVQTVLEQNDQGSWYGVKFTMKGFTDSQSDVEAAKDFYQSLRQGTAGDVRYHDEQAAEGQDGKF
jgi:hypothetical protein